MAKLSRAQRTTRKDFQKLIDTLQAQDLDSERTQRAIISSLRRVKQADQEARQAESTQLQMFAGHDCYAYMPSFIQPRLIR